MAVCLLVLVLVDLCVCVFSMVFVCLLVLEDFCVF